jgi:hypothetical protein
MRLLFLETIQTPPILSYPAILIGDEMPELNSHLGNVG